MAASTAEPGAIAAGCPRCGYDMAGHVGAWADRCPLESECPECGLAFAWRGVLVEDRRRLAWASLVWAVLMIPAVLAGVVAWCLVYVYAGAAW